MDTGLYILKGLVAILNMWKINLLNYAKGIGLVLFLPVVQVHGSPVTVSIFKPEVKSTPKTVIVIGDEHTNSDDSAVIKVVMEVVEENLASGTSVASILEIRPTDSEALAKRPMCFIPHLHQKMKAMPLSAEGRAAFRYIEGDIRTGGRGDLGKVLNRYSEEIRRLLGALSKTSKEKDVRLVRALHEQLGRDLQGLTTAIAKSAIRYESFPEIIYKFKTVWVPALLKFHEMYPDPKDKQAFESFNQSFERFGAAVQALFGDQLEALGGSPTFLAVEMRLHHRLGAFLDGEYSHDACVGLMEELLASLRAMGTVYDPFMNTLVESGFLMSTVEALDDHDLVLLVVGDAHESMLSKSFKARWGTGALIRREVRGGAAEAQGHSLASFAHALGPSSFSASALAGLIGGTARAEAVSSASSASSAPSSSNHASSSSVSGSKDTTGQQPMSRMASSEGEIHKCAHCSATSTTMLRCGRCHSVWYCNKQCQTSDWARHRASCQKK